MYIQVMGISDLAVGGGSRMQSSSPSNYPQILNDANKHRTRCSRQSTSSSSVSSSSSNSSLQLSSLMLKADGKKSSSEPLKRYSPARALDQENAVGIIGGVSVLSTLIFLEKLTWWSSRDGGRSVPFIVCSDPMLKQEAYIPSMKLSFSGEKCVLSGVDEVQLIDNLRRKRAYLEEGGARCIVMPCNLSHAWFREISQGTKLPFLHVAECVAMELKAANLKPLEAGSGIKIGVIGTDATLMAGFYQENLQNQGFEVVLPDKATMERIIYPAIESLNRRDTEGALNLLRVAIQLLLVRAVNVVILASDELQGLLPHNDPLSKKCVDPIDSLARSAIRWAQSVKVTRKS